MDSILATYMPFVQKDVLDLMDSMPVDKRRNGRLFKQIINTQQKELTEFPLAKGGATHPFGLSSVNSRLWIKIKNKMGFKFSDDTEIKVLLDQKEYIFDILNSRSFVECGYYNHSSIRNIIENFFSGDYSYSGQVDWWLSFELFRQNVLENSN